MKSSRPRIKFLQTPHSISRRIEAISNRTASALLSLITRKTVGFGQGSVELSYRQIAAELHVDVRTISSAAKLLESEGDIIRERTSHRIYRWKIVLQKDEILEDPANTYVTRNTPVSDQLVRIDRSAWSGSIDQHHADRSISMQASSVEQMKPVVIEPQSPSIEQKTEAVKISIKDTYLKKQQQEPPAHPVDSKPSQTETLAVRRTDDEPLHKFCLRELKKLGVSQRVARQLCNEHDHNLIASVVKLAPQRPGIQNLAAYVVSEIRDGGYERGKKNAPQVSGGRSNYAHLTNDKINHNRHNSVKPVTDAPITYRSPEQSRAERETLELQKLEREKAYHEEGKILAQRFKSLPEDLQFRLKLAASVQLSKLVPMTGNRDQMLQDKTFKRLANRTVLECFFAWIDEGLDENQALLHLESKAAA